MVFEIRGKIALITGGASGIGLQLVKALLRNDLKGVTLVDLNPKLGNEALQQIEKEFGPRRAVFIETDVTKIDQLEFAFKKTIDTFACLDIVFNNAGILNDAIWEKQIQINVNGVINGMILAMDKYLPEYKQGLEALIVNTSSIAGLDGSVHVPIYAASKHAVLGLTKSWGCQTFYESNKVRVIAICPGVTNTPLISEMSKRSLGAQYEKRMSDVSAWPTQDPDTLAEQVMDIVKYAPNGSMWVVEGGEPAYQYIFADRTSMKNNAIRKS